MRYYSHVLKHIKSSPIIGVGFGTAKIDRLRLKDIEGYVVYHATGFYSNRCRIRYNRTFTIYEYFLFSFILFILIFNSNIETKEKVYILTLCYVRRL